VVEGHLQKPHPGQYLLDPFLRQHSDIRTQSRPVNRRHLRHDHHALFFQISLARLQQDIARLRRAVQVGGQRANNDGADAGAVKDVVLHDDMGMRGVWNGAA